MRSSGTVSHRFGTQRMTPLGAATLPGDNRANRQIPSLSQFLVRIRQQHRCQWKKTHLESGDLGPNSSSVISHEGRLCTKGTSANLPVSWGTPRNKAHGHTGQQ